MTQTSRPASIGISVRRIVFAPTLLVVLCACEPCDERLEQALFDYQWATESQADERRSVLKSVVNSCPISENGVSNRFSGNTHPAEIHFVVGDYQKAVEALESDQIGLTNMQQFELVSYAANHEDPEVLDLVLASGVDPTIPEPESGVTTIMRASQTAYSPVVRMKRLASLGVDPLAVSRDGFSALDFAIADGKDQAVEQVLGWISADFPHSERLVLFSIDVAERSGNDSRAQQLRDWLTARPADESMKD